jgi:hypothetical protein
LSEASPLFDGIPDLCCQGTGHAPCVCNRKEQVVRLYAAGQGARPFTAEERAQLVDDADHAGEGYYSHAELEAMKDQELAAATLHAWGMYTQGQLG